MKKARTLREMFSFNGFTPKNELKGKFGDPKIRVIKLDRKKKQQAALDAVQFILTSTIEKFALHVTVM